MKMYKFTMMLAAAAMLSLSACKRDSITKDEPTNTGPVTIDIKDLVVPASFNFETEKILNVKVGVTSPAFPGQKSVIKIYTDVPSTGTLISSGLSDANGNYTTTVRIPAWHEYVYVEKVNADGSSEYNKVKASTFVSTQFGGEETTYFFRKAGSGMDCTTGCTITQNNASGWVDVQNGQTVCFTGTLNNPTINVQSGGIVKICGSGSINSITLNGNGKVYILENAVLSVGGLNTYANTVTFKNWSDSLKFTSGMSVTGNLENNGKMYVNGTLNLYNTGTTFENYGTLSITGSLTNGDKFKNYHRTIITSAFENYSGARTDNSCYIKTGGNFNNSGSLFNNSGTIKVGDTYNPYASSINKFDNGAYLSTKNLTSSTMLEGTGTNRSIIKVTNNSTLYNTTILKGKLDYCDSNGIENAQQTLQGTAALSCGGYLATTTCNPEGFGVPLIQDADNDGVADAQDEYPNDATRAFNSYYPNATSTATVAFEDLWPSMGDFDYNDMVVAFNIQKVLNASNKVVDYKVKLKVKAVGASFDNGFGFRLDDVLPSEVANVTGQSLIRGIITRSANNTEASQDKAVIICFDSPEPTLHRATGSMFNTIKANPTGTSDSMYINVTFTSPVDGAKLDIAKFNPFIFTNKRRGYEVHLGNYKPTSLADAALFGTEKDRSEPANNKYYKTPNNLPWAIMLPAGFDYPVERAAITSAYSFFDDWAISGGTSYTNWYTNQSGYRETGNIY